MLDRVDAEHFRPLEGQRLEVQTPGGETLTLVIDKVTPKPFARRPDAPDGERVPFSVTLTAVESTAFTGGPCTLALPALGRLEGVWISRVAALGRDASRGYFQILFN